MQIWPPAKRIQPMLLLLALLIAASGEADAACNIVNGKSYGDCQNVRVHEGSLPALNVRSNVAESSIVAGATVHSGGVLHLSGVSNGDILVKRGGQLLVTGVVSATVRNEGGIVDIEGVVDNLITSGGNAVIGGQVDSFSGRGPARFKKGSVLRGVPLEQTVIYPRTEPTSANRFQ